MKKVVRLSEQDLVKLIKRVIKEDSSVKEYNPHKRMTTTDGKKIFIMKGQNVAGTVYLYLTDCGHTYTCDCSDVQSKKPAPAKFVYGKTEGCPGIKGSGGTNQTSLKSFMLKPEDQQWVSSQFCKVIGGED